MLKAIRITIAEIIWMSAGFIILMCWLPVSAYAQIKQPLKLSLQEAMELGLKSRFDIKAIRYNAQMAQNSLSKSKKAWIPDMQAVGNIQYTTQIQPTYIPKGFVGYNEAGLLTLGAKNTSVFGLSVEQPLFKPEINTEIKIARAGLALQKEKIHGDEINVKNEIAIAYLNVILKELQCQIADSEEMRFKEYKELAAGKYKAGACIKNDLLRTKLDYENARIRAETTSQNYALAMEYLKYQINLPKETSVVLTDSIGTILFEHTILSPEKEIESRTEIRQLQLEQQVNKLQIKRVHQNALPVVSAAGYYAFIYQNQDFHYNESKWWAPHSYIGLQFSIPITSNFSNRNNITEYELKQGQLAFELQQEKSDIQFQVHKAMTDLQNAKQNMQAAKANYALSQTIYKNQQQQFALGVFQYSDLLETERSLDNAEQHYIQAVYDYMTAQITYEKATGML